MTPYFVKLISKDISFDLHTALEGKHYPHFTDRELKLRDVASFVQGKL